MSSLGRAQREFRDRVPGYYTVNPKTGIVVFRSDDQAETTRDRDERNIPPSLNLRVKYLAPDGSFTDCEKP